MQELIDKYKAELEVLNKKHSDCRSQYFDSGTSCFKRDELREELTEIRTKKLLINQFISDLETKLVSIERVF